MAKKFGKTTVSEEALEADTEIANLPPGEPPKKIAAGERSGPPGDGGGRRVSKTAAAPGFVARTVQFLRDTRAEMRRVSWPNANLVKNSTIITLIAVVFFAVYLFAIDRVWSFLIGHLKTWLGG